MSAFELSDLSFRKSADPDLVSAAATNDVAVVRRKLVKRWAKRKLRLDLFGPATISSSIFAGVWATEADASLIQQAETTDARKKKSVGALVQNCVTRVQNNSASDFVVLLGSELLLRFSDWLSNDQFLNLLLALVRQPVDDVGFDEADESTDIPEDFTGHLIRQVIRGAELANRQAVLLDDVSAFRDRQKQADKVIIQAMNASSDTDGTLQASIAHSIGSWLAPFSRIGYLSHSAGQKPPAGKNGRRFQNALEYAVSLSTQSGWLTNGCAGDQGRSVTAIDLLQPLSKWYDNPRKSSLCDAISSLRKLSTREAKSRTGKRLDWYTPSVQSDWSESALLRSGYEGDADSVLLDWFRDPVGLSVATLGSPLVSGHWGSQISINEQVEAEPGHWACTCWFQDDDVAFAELERVTSGSVRHVRHVMLHLTDHYLLLNDTVTHNDPAASLSLKASLDIACTRNGHSCQASADPVTREIRLKTDGPECRVIPAWLPDDRIQSASGQCQLQDRDDGTSQLTWEDSGIGGLHLPLFIDWHPNRMVRDADWNRLTITEDRRLVTGHEAAAVRIRIGRLQLLLYRSLTTGQVLRTALGHHTSNETVYGRFRNDGQVDSLVLVEGTTGDE